MKRIFQLSRTKLIVSTIVILVVIGVGVYLIFFHNSNSSNQTINVTQGSITETVSVTGNTTAMQSVSLGFQNTGAVSSVNFQVGDTVSAGQVLAVLNTNNLQAQLKQAQASVDAEQAKLQGLQAGAQPEDIAASQAAVDKANQDLANLFMTIPDTSSDSYTKGNDAVRTQLYSLFTNGDSANPQLTFQTNDSGSAIKTESDRSASGIALTNWQNELLSVNTSSSVDSLNKLLTDGITNLSLIKNLLADVSTALNGSTSLNPTIVAQYKTSISTALNEVNIASTNLSTISQNIASQKTVVAQAEADLALKKAGSTSEDIAAQQASVEQAQANVSSVDAQIQNMEIVAPISGVVTQMDAKIGQIASPNTPLVSIISENNYEVDAFVPETDIGKVAVSDPVSMTFDAFPGQTFTGSVFYIDPAETVNQGVVDYKIKVSVQNQTQLKSGLTANLNIQTKKKDNALILPQYAVLQNDQGTFVEVMKNGKVENDPVTLGIQDQNGNVEIVSGVTLGEQVLNIGLK